MTSANALWALALLLTLSAHATALSLSEAHNISSQSESTLLSNEYYNDGDSFWVSKSYFQPIQESTYGTLQIRNALYMQFTLVWHGLSDMSASSRPYEGIFRIGAPSREVSDCNGHATRYPALYLDRRNQALQFSLSDDVDCWGVGLLNASYHGLQQDVPYMVTIQFNQTWVIIQVNQHTILNGRRPGSTPSRMLGSTASVIISDSLDPSANVTLYDMIILSYDTNLSTFPTEHPTPPPTVLPRAHTNELTTSSSRPTEAVPQSTEESLSQFQVTVTLHVLFSDTSNTSSHLTTRINSSTVSSMITHTFHATTAWNMSAWKVSIDPSLIIATSATLVNTQREVDALVSYLQYNMSQVLIDLLESRYDWLDVIDVTYQLTVKELIKPSTNNISVDSDETTTISSSLSSLLSLNHNTVLLVIAGFFALCCCSSAICACTLYRYNHLRRKMNQFERKHTRCHSVSVVSTNKQDTPSTMKLHVPHTHQESCRRLSQPSQQSQPSLHSQHSTHSLRDSFRDNLAHSLPHEAQRFSHSLSNVLPLTASPDDISLGKQPMMHVGSEGIEKMNTALYQRVCTALPLMEDEDSHHSDRDLLTHGDVTQEFVMSKQDEMLESMRRSQHRLTDPYSNAEDEDLDNLPSMQSNTESSGDSMYGEGCDQDQEEFLRETATHTPGAIKQDTDTHTPL